MLGKTILLVEDEALIALLEIRQLEEVGYQVVHAFSGEEAIGLVRHGADPVDLVLMDIDLGGGMDGTKAAQEILARHDIPLLFLSGHQEKELVDKTEQITNYGYVVKNSAFTVLYASIKMAFKLFEAKKKLSQKHMEIEAGNEELRVTIEELEAANHELFALEDKFSKAFHLNPDAININRLSDGVYLDINEGFTRTMGYTREDAIGRSSLPGDLGIWVHAEDRTRLTTGLLAQGEVANLEAQFRSKDGTIVDGLMSARLIEIDGERCIISITRDVTERRRIQSALRESEALFRTAFDNAPVGFSLTSPDGSMQMVNQAFCDMVGRTRDEVNGQEYSRITHPEDVAQSLAMSRLLLSGEKDYVRFRKRYLRKDGQTVWAEVSISLMRDQAGAPLYFIVHSLDITLQNLREAELVEGERHYQALLTGIREGFCHQDENEVFRFANPAAERIFGVEAGGLLGRKAQDFLDAEGEAILEAEGGRRRAGLSSSYLSPILRADGVRRWLRINAAPVEDGTGRFIGSSIIFTDATEEVTRP